MKWFVALVAVCMATTTSAADRMLAPDWSSSVAQGFLKSKTRVPEELASFSLPVLGLPLEKLRGADEIERRRKIDRSRVGTVWPSCAGEPRISLAADASRTWFARQYDFGCMQIGITGDRHVDDRRYPSLEGQTSSDAQVSVMDENNDPASVGSVAVDFVRYRLPYRVTIDCSVGAGPFCRNVENVRRLAASLVIEGGRPQ